MPVLSHSERDAFLAERGIVMRIAVVRGDGSPLVTPIWFVHVDDAIYFTPREQSEWFSCLRDDARVALCIDEQPLPYRKVIVEGVAELVYDIGQDDDWRGLYRSIAKRYVSEDAAEAYVQNTIDQPRGLYRVGLSVANIKTWRMPLADESAAGMWHQRYYRPGSKYSTGER